MRSRAHHVGLDHGLIKLVRSRSTRGAVSAVSSTGATFERITIEPDKMGGQPCIRGLRFPVVTVLRMVAGGMTVEDILDEHPDLDDISAALNNAAEALAEHYYPLRPPA